LQGTRGALSKHLIKTSFKGSWCFLFDYIAIIRHIWFQEFKVPAHSK